MTSKCCTLLLPHKDISQSSFQIHTHTHTHHHSPRPDPDSKHQVEFVSRVVQQGEAPHSHIIVSSFRTLSSSSHIPFAESVLPAKMSSTTAAFPAYSTSLAIVQGKGPYAPEIKDIDRVLMWSPRLTWHMCNSDGQHLLCHWRQPHHHLPATAAWHLRRCLHQQRARRSVAAALARDPGPGRPAGGV